MGHSSVLSSMDSTSNGLQILKQRKSDARMSRITDLLSVEATLSSANQKELDNLIISDTYDPKSFSESHRGFKTTHNNVFAALGAYCSSTNNKSDTKALTEESITEVIYINKPVFYLDGFEGESTKTLRAAGYEDSDLYTANLFENTAAVLKSVHRVNTFHGRAHESLETVFSSVPFCCYYLDGCSGSSQSIVEMIKSIFTEKRLDAHMITSQTVSTIVEITTDNTGLDKSMKNEGSGEVNGDRLGDMEKKKGSGSNPLHIKTLQKPLNCFCIGFTLTNAGGRDSRLLVDRDQEVTKCICTMGKMFGFSMTYVGDDPESYGLESSPIKREGDIQTTWIMLRRLAIE